MFVNDYSNFLAQCSFSAGCASEAEDDMANASIGGLVSGLDTATIISQLMQLEAQPRTQLQSRVSSNQRELSALQTFNSKLAAIASHTHTVLVSTSAFGAAGA